MTLNRTLVKFEFWVNNEEYVSSKFQICTGKIYAKKLFVVYVKFPFVWTPCVILPTL